MTSAYKLVFLLVCILLASGIGAQSGQVVTGRVIDAATSRAVELAKVEFIRDQSVMGMAFSDSLGIFESTFLKPGPLSLRISHVAYDTLFLPGLTLTMGKSLQVRVVLQRGTTALQEIQVRSTAFLSDPATQMRILRIRDVEKLAGNFYDPARLAQTQNGISVVNDQANQLSIYGLPPHFIQWNLNGHEIVNPNHLSNAGTLSDKPTPTGGGVNILSHQMLDYSILRLPGYTFPSDNALAGIMDMRLRKGNTHAPEWRVKGSLIGLEAAGEGPVPSVNQASYLFNLRYSTVGLLDQLGVVFGDESINFADASFHVQFPDKELRTQVSVFGVGGLSRNTFRRPDDPMDFEEEKDLSDINYEEDNGIFGLNFSRLIGQRSIFHAGSAYSRVHRYREEERFDSLMSPILFQTDQSVEQKLSAFIRFQTRFGPRMTLNAGIKYLQHTVDANGLLPKRNTFSQDRKYTIDHTRSYVLPWIQLGIKLHANLRLDAGMGYSISDQEDDFPIHASLGMSYRFSGTTQLTVSLSRFIQRPNPGLQEITIGEQTYPNEGLTSMIGNQGHVEFTFTRGRVRSLTRVFGGVFDKLPASSGNSIPGYTLFNGFIQPLAVPLVADSEGRNYGIAQILRFRAPSSWYSQLSVSLYRAEYRPGNASTGGTWNSGAYSNNLSGSLSIGREYKLKSKQIHANLGWNLTVHAQGGLREARIDAEASAASDVTVFLYHEGYSEQLGTYFRPDVQIYLEKDYKNSSTRLALDIQNVANIENDAYRYFDHFLGKVVTKTQLGIIPVLSYQIDF